MKALLTGFCALLCIGCKPHLGMFSMEFTENILPKEQLIYDACTQIVEKIDYARFNGKKVSLSVDSEWDYTKRTLEYLLARKLVQGGAEIADTSDIVIGTYVHLSGTQSKYRVFFNSLECTVSCEYSEKRGDAVTEITHTATTRTKTDVIPCVFGLLLFMMVLSFLSRSPRR